MVHYQAIALSDLVDEGHVLVGKGVHVILSSDSMKQEYIVTPDFGVQGLPFTWPKHDYAFGSLIKIPETFFH